MSDAEEVFDVERIINDRVFKGKRQYLIKWVGYPDSQNTWELEENLMCEELLAEYIVNKKKQAEIAAAEKKAKEALKPTKQAKKEETAPQPVETAPVVQKLVESPLLQSFKRELTNEWHDEISAVLGAYLNKEGVLEIEFVLKDGTRATASGEEMHYKAPLRLIEFYEENLSFPE